MRKILGSLLALSIALGASAATTRNDDSCDIAVMPAATLLLPFFEVDVDDPNGETTLVTITNAANLDAIARVTLWTDRGYPVFTFNVVLTGYDVHAMNLYDIIGRGVLAANERPNPARPRGEFSDPNPGIDACAGTSGELTDAIVARMRSALTTGSIEGECEDVGGVHDNATGYATIDVVGNCSTNTPRDRGYWSTDLRYDNILLGDYQQLHVGQGLAQGGPLVHIRAIPEGGTPRERRPSDDAGFPRTFYSRFQASTSPKLDARQPLPSRFAARWTEGTSLKIWREGRAGVDGSCADFAADQNLAVADLVAFDEHENGVGIDGARVELTASTSTAVADPIFPQLANGASNGWIYLNLDRSRRDDLASQAWVVSSTRVEGRYSSDFDTIALGNGCSVPAAPDQQIAPSPNENEHHGLASTGNDDSCDIALLPAATLLLPYFEVDLRNPRGETTIFTVTNVSPEDRIARVTLWTDFSYPVISFNVYLTGYDVQSINLYDVIARGWIAPDTGTGTQITPRGPLSDRNFDLDLGACARLVGQLPAPYVGRMRLAFTEGTVPELDTLAGCNNIGLEHDHAVGYATIDVVRNCAENLPTSAQYWTEDIAWDNVLIGDFHQVHSGNDFAQSSALVHIRAIPEGGTSAERRAVQRKYDAGFPRTFYARLQSPDAPKLDGRQPLPSVFAARWIQGHVSDYRTYFKIWREATTGRETTCAAWDENLYTYTEAARFDEAENAVADVPSRITYPVYDIIWLPSTVLLAANDSSVLPQMPNGAIGGWIYLNLDDHDPERPWPSQNWVVTSMRAQGRYSVDIDAAAMGNGCSAQVPLSETTTGTEVIGPRP